MIKIIVNTISTKKNAGGAFQIAVNFIHAALLSKDSTIEWYYFTSSDVDDVVGKYFNEEKGKHYFVVPTQPQKNTYLQVKKQLKKWEELINPDLIYTISAPCYHHFKTKEVMRFTNPWVAHPNQYAWSVLSTKERVKMKAYCRLQRHLIKKAHFFVTQTDDVKNSLIQTLNIPSDNIAVVPNVLPAFIRKEDNSHIDDKDGLIHVASVAAADKHKNLDIIPDVIYILSHTYNIENIVFHLTLPENTQLWKSIETKARKLGVNSKIINHGRVNQHKLCNDIYRKSTIAFLPTLLEVFSASTIEALFFGLKIVATNFSFNTQVLGDTALYYEPMNAEDAAKKLFQVLTDEKLAQSMSEAIHKQLEQFGDYESHFNGIVSFLKDVALRS